MLGGDFLKLKIIKTLKINKSVGEYLGSQFSDGAQPDFGGL